MSMSPTQTQWSLSASNDTSIYMIRPFSPSVVCSTALTLFPWTNWSKSAIIFWFSCRRTGLERGRTYARYTSHAASRWQLCRYNIQHYITLELFRVAKYTALSYSARRNNSTVCCSKMSCDAFLSKALYEADKALEKFAAALREPTQCVCLQDGGRSRRWIANVCFILLFCVIWVLTASIFVYICSVDCCIAALLQTVM